MLGIEFPFSGCKGQEALQLWAAIMLAGAGFVAFGEPLFQTLFSFGLINWLLRR